jgi:hypothetical protein
MFSARASMHTSAPASGTDPSVTVPSIDPRTLRSTRFARATLVTERSRTCDDLSSRHHASASTAMTRDEHDAPTHDPASYCGRMSRGDRSRAASSNRSALTDDECDKSIPTRETYALAATMRRDKQRVPNLAKWCRVVVQETRVRLRVR